MIDQSMPSAASQLHRPSSLRLPPQAPPIDRNQSQGSALAAGGGVEADAWYDALANVASAALPYVVKALSDRTLKRDITVVEAESLSMPGQSGQPDSRLAGPVEPVNGFQVLNLVADLPISTWRYHWESSQVRHLGPMAQDWAATFGLGEDDTGIALVDANGVALVSIQALYRLVGDLRQELADLRERVEPLLVSDEERSAADDSTADDSTADDTT